MKRNRELATARESNSALNASKEVCIAEKEYLQEIRRLRVRLQNAMKHDVENALGAAAGAAKVEHAFLSGQDKTDDSAEQETTTTRTTMKRIMVLDRKIKKKDDHLKATKKKIKELTDELKVKHEDERKARTALSETNKVLLECKDTLCLKDREIKNLKESLISKNTN